MVFGLSHEGIEKYISECFTKTPVTPGYRAQIQIVSTSNHKLYETTCTSPDEVKKFISTYGKSKQGYGLLQGVILPLRTDNLKDFAKDLFLPTFFNFSLKINNFAIKKFFSSILAIPLDLATLPLRVFTTPYQVYRNHNYKEEKHPLLNLNPQIKDDVVQLHYGMEDAQLDTPTCENADTFQKANQCITSGTIQVALKRLPGGTTKQSSEIEHKHSYLRKNNAWALKDSGIKSRSESTFTC